MVPNLSLSCEPVPDRPFQILWLEFAVQFRCIGRPDGGMEIWSMRGRRSTSSHIKSAFFSIPRRISYEKIEENMFGQRSLSFSARVGD